MRKVVKEWHDWPVGGKRNPGPTLHSPSYSSEWDDDDGHDADDDDGGHDDDDDEVDDEVGDDENGNDNEDIGLHYVHQLHWQYDSWDDWAEEDCQKRKNK